MEGSKTIEMHLLAALVTILVTAASAAHPQVESLKARILANLGMAGPPDMSAVNTSESEMQMMMREYEMRVRKSEEEEERDITPDDVLIYDTIGCLNGSIVLFHPKLSNDIDVTSARLIFPDNTTRDASFWVQQWREYNDLDSMVVPCCESHCCRSRLELKVRQPTSNNECYRRSLKVSFDDIGWNWLVQPREIEVYYCEGGCSTLMAPVSNIQTVVQKILSGKGGSVPMPSCVPETLKSMHLMYYDAHQLVLTEMKDMIVQECACA